MIPYHFVGALNFKPEVPGREADGAAAHDYDLLDGIGGCYGYPVFFANLVSCFFDVLICGFGLLGKDDFKACMVLQVLGSAVNSVGVENKYYLLSSVALEVDEYINKFVPCGFKIM